MATPIVVSILRHSINVTLFHVLEKPSLWWINVVTAIICVYGKLWRPCDLCFESVFSVGDLASYVALLI